jgi:hypothetical protein
MLDQHDIFCIPSFVIAVLLMSEVYVMHLRKEALNTVLKWGYSLTITHFLRIRNKFVK